jgi:thiol-disulfide isomerase/thioredoxin
MIAVLATTLGLHGTSPGQDSAKRLEPSAPRVGRPSPSSEAIRAIDEEYARQRLGLERHRLERLEQLAASQNPAEAAATYEKLFRLAIDSDLFGDAERAAKTVLATGSPSPAAIGLAYMVKIVAEADRGAYDQSLESLQQAVTERQKAAPGGQLGTELPTDEVVEICDAYFQRLIQGAHYDNARKALNILLGHTNRPAFKEFLSSRVRRLEVVGKPAPLIRGTDLEGKPFDLADFRGKKAVLVVFWASWCLPCEPEVELLHEIQESYGARGLQIVGINLDALSSGDPKSGSVLPTVRHFLLDYNVTWPTLMNGQGDKDYTGAYGVTEIPANVLVGKDGTVLHIDLVRKNLGPMVARALGQ